MFKTCKMPLSLAGLFISLVNLAVCQDLQPGYYRTVQLKGNIGATGYITIDPLSFKKKDKPDSLLLEINNAISISDEPNDVLNVLSQKQWELITVTAVTPTAGDFYFGRPFLMYYIKKYIKYKP